MSTILQFLFIIIIIIIIIISYLKLRNYAQRNKLNKNDYFKP